MSADPEESQAAPAATTGEKVVAQLHELGVRAGDTLLVHSSLRAVGPVEGGGEGLLDALLRALQPNGLLVLPTHTWDIVNERQPVWHETLTPSHVGVLTNLARNRPEAIRSIHPSHSVAAIGQRAADFCGGHENDDSPCSPTSPYGKLLEARGKILLLGVGLTRCTFIHCLEEIAGLGEIWSLSSPSRRFCIRADGTVIPVMARAHIHGVSDNFGRAERDLLDAGAITEGRVGGARVLLVDAPGLAEFLLPRFRENPRYFW